MVFSSVGGKREREFEDVVEVQEGARVSKRSSTSSHSLLVHCNHAFATSNTTSSYFRNLVTFTFTFTTSITFI